MNKLSTDIRRIAIFRALQLGDMLCAIPAIRALRSAYPEAHITLLGLPWAEPFCKRFAHYFDDFIHFPGYEGLPEQVFTKKSWDNFVQLLRTNPFDLILQMQGNGSIVNDMLEGLHAGAIAGFHSDGNYRTAPLYLPYPTDISEVERHLRLMQYLGIAPHGTSLEFPVTEIEKQNLYCKHPFVTDTAYVCVHPGSRGTWRQWPVAHFAASADVCAAAGYKVVLTGTKEESKITAEVISLMHYPVIDLAGQTSLGEMGQLIKDAQLLISNCTGVSHIAAAMQTKSIVISMDGEPGRWAPLNKNLHKTFDWTTRQDLNEVLAATKQLLHSDFNATFIQ